MSRLPFCERSFAAIPLRKSSNSEHRALFYRYVGFEVRKDEGLSSRALVSELCLSSRLEINFEPRTTETELHIQPAQSYDDDDKDDRIVVDLGDNHRCYTACTCNMPKCNELLTSAQSNHDVFLDPLVVNAFLEAEKAHMGQYRATGDPYLVHCVETASILAGAGASKNVVAAGLLHDVLDETAIDATHLRQMFGDDITSLVEGVSRLSELSQIARDNNTITNLLEADHLRTMLLAMVDVRVVLIKLADRLHNMRTLGALPAKKHKRIASETLEVFAPLASRLGIWRWKAELQDLCFMYLWPQEHQRLLEELSENPGEGHVFFTLKKLDMILRSAGVHFHDLCGRTKNLYSIYSKMLRKGKSLKEICDLRGLRLIVEDVNSCYAALKLIHGLWPRIPGKQKDYISHPKSNGYQSLHTAVMCEDGFPLEVQIRTLEMHRNAEFGVAAHWRYKEGDSKQLSSASQRVAWARWVLTWHGEVLGTELRLSPSEIDLRPLCLFPLHAERCAHHSVLPQQDDDLLYVVLVEDEKMIVKELPNGTRARDVLVRLGSSGRSEGSGFNCWKETRLLINHKITEDLDQELAMGDIVELVPHVKEESLDKCREEIRRMFGDSATTLNCTANQTVASTFS